ncbi:translation initiation factor IF-2 [Nitzschia inconspicua]|uniref:Translation initiation factor IF-2 n=1 Tax=Nitzschia inconspicua TaxID=303405 RepID=A0A9K3PB65_9STRA|nr:translation initiation factor IF-2 [Nitzschia inconspicua]
MTSSTNIATPSISSGGGGVSSSSSSSTGKRRTSQVLEDLKGFLKRGDGNGDDDLFDMSVMATPVAAIKALLGVVQRSNATTMMELQDELKQAREEILEHHQSSTSSSSSSSANRIGLSSGCDLFLRYATRTFLEFPDFQASRNEMLERGQRFASLSLAARDRIALVAADFIQEGQTVLIHGWSRVVASILLKAAVQQGKHFDIIVLEGRPDAAGIKVAKAYASHNSKIPTTVILDSAMGYIMEKVDIVLVGAEAVVENGGCVNKMGTYALATCAKAHGKPFYVASESYKFARLFPLNQQDLSNMGSSTIERDGPFLFADTSSKTFNGNDDGKDDELPIQPITLPKEVNVENSPCDFTPAKFITLLFTDLGVLTPSAVSDELIRLYQ